MSEKPKPLDKETLDRLAREWDKKIGQGSFSLHASARPKPDGTQEDSIRIVKSGGKVEVITDEGMTSDLN